MEFHIRAQALKKQRTLTPRSEEDFDSYANSACQADHMLRLYRVALENRDLLSSLSAGKAYSVPEDVKVCARLRVIVTRANPVQDAIATYSQVFILSPTVLGYKKKSNPATVLATLRALNVTGIPPEQDQGRAQVVLKVITKALTDARHQVKEEIQASLQSYAEHGKGAPGADIASLTHACIGSAKTKATLGLFMRVAFLRWVMAEYPSKTSKFWDEVDIHLSEIRRRKKTAVERETAAKIIYDDDLEKYGPLNLEFAPTSSERLEEWIKTINRYAGASLDAPPL
ncbi:hypothetical protein NMY22_g11575 [Coprinellus aureogranulatus]|nr:hypothetical protein NMY22_g11575 [Coprinellus aureogranulatus]